MPNFEILTCNDPYFGALPFVKVPENFKENHQCVFGECQSNLLKDPNVISYMKKKDPHPNVIYFLVEP
jgi:hypothetical protein